MSRQSHPSAGVSPATTRSTSGRAAAASDSRSRRHCSIADAAAYFRHRLFHTSSVLWRFHRIHHSMTELYWIRSAYTHPLEQLCILMAIMLPIALLGAGDDVVAVVALRVRTERAASARQHRQSLVRSELRLRHARGSSGAPLRRRTTEPFQFLGVLRSDGHSVRHLLPAGAGGGAGSGRTRGGDGVPERLPRRTWRCPSGGTPSDATAFGNEGRVRSRRRTNRSRSRIGRSREAMTIRRRAAIVLGAIVLVAAVVRASWPAGRTIPTPTSGTSTEIGSFCRRSSCCRNRKRGPRTSPMTR